MMKDDEGWRMMENDGRLLRIMKYIWRVMEDDGK